MKIKILTLLFSLFLIGFAFGQNKIKFKKGIELVENNLSLDFKNPESILFIFNVVGCQANFYNDLAKNLKKKFKKSETKIIFNFEINTKVETEKIPTKVYSKNEAELICYVETSDIKSWDNHLEINKRKQNYNLNLLFKKNKTKDKIGILKINVNSYYTILTQNKNSSKLIYQAIIE